jgi:hypothetical protein
VEEVLARRGCRRGRVHGYSPVPGELGRVAAAAAAEDKGEDPAASGAEPPSA